jgi:1,4-dihydroxy-2-naphthoate octaprenyltransferase
MNTFKSLLGPMRVPFLILTPACVAVGVGTAYWQSNHIVWYQIILVLVGALACHVCVNVFNEYFDFISGLDARTKPTPPAAAAYTANPSRNAQRTWPGLAALPLRPPSGSTVC